MSKVLISMKSVAVEMVDLVEDFYKQLKRKKISKAEDKLWYYYANMEYTLPNLWLFYYTLEILWRITKIEKEEDLALSIAYLQEAVKARAYEVVDLSEEQKEE